jgi:hypothetical protein
MAWARVESPMRYRMKHTSTVAQMARATASTSGRDAAAGPQGLAIAPPAYGLEVVDSQAIQGAAGAGMRTTVSTADRGAAAGPQGLAIAPPAYGLEMVDSQTTQRTAGAGSGRPRPANQTGLPDTLKTGIEGLSGLAMDDVKVHFNSAEPARLEALAYTRGTEIHVGPGQEMHLPHEAWHVVQQKQGRVRPTLQTKGAGINDDQALEQEATLMGEKANRGGPASWPGTEPSVLAHSDTGVIQRVTAPSYTNAGIVGPYNGAVDFQETANHVVAESPDLDLTGTVTIAPGEPESQNTGIEIGFVQTLVESSGTAKYGAHNGKEERAQLALAPQPIRDGTAGQKPWYEMNDAREWDGTPGDVTTTLYDRPHTNFPRYGKEDGQQAYAIEGKDKFKTWLIAWKDNKAKYLYWYTWTVDFRGTRTAGVWTAVGTSTNTGSGAGAGRNPGAAELDDPVANDELKWRWRKT